jgi:hypothetical protein
MAALQDKIQGGEFVQYTKFLLSDGETYVVCGELHGDHRWRDGALIHTFPVVCHHVEEKILETRNTFYMLGEEITEESNPDIRKMLLTAL